MEEKKEYQANLPSTEKRDSLQGLLKQDSVKKRFEDVLGKKAAGFMSSIISATNANTMLSKAEPMSIIRAAAIAAALDLPINPSLGFSHIVPYKKDGEPIAQFQMGWKGFVQLALRTGQYKTINATPVYEGELQSKNRFTGEMVFDEAKKESDKIVGYVAYFKLINGFEKWLYMGSEEVKAHGKRYSQSYSTPKGKWMTDFESMALKTVIKMLLSKYGVLSIEMQTAILGDQATVKKDGEFEYPDGKGEIIEAEEVPTNAEKLTERISGKKEEELAPGPCPNNGNDTYTKKHCDGCKDRVDCPTWR